VYRPAGCLAMITPGSADLQGDLLTGDDGQCVSHSQGWLRYQCSIQ
jgi:hypothetical protein